MSIWAEIATSICHILLLANSSCGIHSIHSSSFFLYRLHSSFPIATFFQVCTSKKFISPQAFWKAEAAVLQNTKFDSYVGSLVHNYRDLVGQLFLSRSKWNQRGNINSIGQECDGWKLVCIGQQSIHARQSQLKSQTSLVSYWGACFNL